MSDGWMQTYTGRQFWPLRPDAADIDILDIAHALSNLCRFAGHTRCFYSVAQHSVLVSEICSVADSFHGLLHDAAEAYCIDMPRPIKHALDMKPYRDIERGIERAIAKRFGLSLETPMSVKLADNAILATERRDLLGPSPAMWKDCPTASGHPRIRAWQPTEAKERFLNRFEDLESLTPRAFVSAKHEIPLAQDSNSSNEVDQ